MLSYDELIGRTLLAHLTIYKNGRLSEERALFGEIEYADKGGIVFKAENGEQACFPGNLEGYVPAIKGGAYEFLEDGAIRTVSPDFFTAWDVNNPSGCAEDTKNADF